MFKKVAAVFSVVLLGMLAISAVASAQPKEIKENVQYQVLKEPISKESSVIEIFSFYCGICSAYNQAQVIPYLDAHLDDGVQVQSYHVSHLGPLSDQLTQAWSIAQVLGIQNKVETDIFEGVQTGKIRSEKDIVKLFEKYGVTQDKYNAMKSNSLVKMLDEKQHTAEKRFQVSSVPMIIVDDHYAILPLGLDNGSSEAFKVDLARVINYLLTKDKQAR